MLVRHSEFSQISRISSGDLSLNFRQPFILFRRLIHEDAQSMCGGPQLTNLNSILFAIFLVIPHFLAL